MGANSHDSGVITDTDTWELGSTNVKILVIMILIFHMTNMLVFLAVFGAWRRRSRSSFWRVMLWLSYTTSVALIPYILGLIQEAPSKDEFLIIWGMLLLIIYTFPDSFSAYSPEDVTQWRLQYVQFMVKFCALAILWVRVADSELYSDFNPWVLYLFTAIVFLKVVKRSMAQIFASPLSIEERAKTSEVYMTHEHELSDESQSDPLTMKGYHYLVAVAGNKRLSLDDVLQSSPFNLKEFRSRDDVVTLEKVWRYQGRLLTERGDSDSRIKDICLSYSLLKILYLKCAGFALPANAQPKARKLILEGLLSNKENDRAFRVIEVELKLLYELIYTKYPLYASPIFAGSRVLEFNLLLATCCLSASSMSNYVSILECVKVSRTCVFSFEFLGTYVLLGMIVFADITQLWMIFSSEWVKVSLIFNYVANKYCLNNVLAEKIISMICRQWFWKPWARVLGQYSLLESRRYGTESWLSNLTSAMYPEMNRDCQCESKAVRLSNEVKNAVLDCLRRNETNFDNGKRSLRLNLVYEKLHEACESKHVAEDILVWHVATSYCLYKSSVSRDTKKNREIAKNLSNYLAYLVAFAPRLLPGPHFEPQFHFRSAMKEAREAFKDCSKVEQKIRALESLSNKQQQTIIVKGARLGTELFKLEREEGANKLWKTLAEFWSEMVLSAATSGEVRAHLEKLANGGEFITHLWALLHHAGYSAGHPTSPP